MDTGPLLVAKTSDSMSLGRISSNIDRLSSDLSLHIRPPFPYSKNVSH